MFALLFLYTCFNKEIQRRQNNLGACYARICYVRFHVCVLFCPAVRYGTVIKKRSPVVLVDVCTSIGHIGTNGVPLAPALLIVPYIMYLYVFVRFHGVKQFIFSHEGKNGGGPPPKPDY